MNKNTCNSCAWYCHSDGRCWANSMGENPAYPLTVQPSWSCDEWTADGLIDEERASLYADALVTMEVES